MNTATAPDLPATSTLRYYKATLSGLTYRELWSMGTLSSAFIVWILKACGNNMLLAQGTPEPVHLDQMRLDPSAIAEDLRAPLDLMLGQVVPLGFSGPIYYRTPALIAGIEAAAVTCLHKDREILANLLVAKSNQQQRAVVSFISACADQTFFCSANDKDGFLRNPRNGTLFLKGASASKVFDRHEKARRSWAKGREVRTVTTESELAQALLDYELSMHQWHVDRGAYIQMTDEEVESARQQCASAATCCA